MATTDAADADEGDPTDSDGDDPASAEKDDPASVEENDSASAEENDSASADGDELDRAAVRERLDRVDDPELDRSIVELGYVEEVRIDGGDVEVSWVLPTAWCSPAFAWMMATGIRDEVERLPGVMEVTIDLRDHMHAEEITEGVNERRPFEAAFPEAESGVDAARRKLDEKSRLARQHTAVEALLDAGVAPEQVATLEPGRLERAPDTDRTFVSLRDGAVLVAVDSEPLERYLEKARATGLVTADDDPLFADPDGDPIDPEAFERVHSRARAAKVNVEGQGSVCAALHESRNGVAMEDGPR